MRRTLLHLIFWFVYTIQDTVLHFTWMSPIIAGIPLTTQWIMAIQSAVILLPPKVLLVYYITSYGLKKVLEEEQVRIIRVLEFILMLIVSLLLFRIIFYYSVYPSIYNLPNKVSFIHPRNILISLLEIGYISAVAITIKLLRMQIVSKEKERSLVKEKLETELRFLRNQTNPHFLFNTLNNIYALARKKSDKTAEIVMKLSEILSFILYESKKETISLADEIKMLKDYIILERIRYSDRLSINFKTDVDNDNERIAPLLLLPLVENAFKHGVSETRFDSFIDINLSLQKGHLNFNIENSTENGYATAKDNRIGLNNITRQLELMYKEHKINLQHLGNSFKVDIAINLNSYGKI